MSVLYVFSCTKIYTANGHGDITIDVYQYCISLSRGFEPMAEGYSAFILGVGCIDIEFYFSHKRPFKLFVPDN